MKVGRLVYDRKQEGMSEKVFCNYGDNIQTIALDSIIEDMFDAADIVDMNIYDLPYYEGEYVLLPLNCNLWTCDENYFLPASDKVIPVFIAVSFQIPPTSIKSIEYLRRWQPIGCRDFETLTMMRKLGIQAYLNGCVTLTLPRRTQTPNKKKIFLVGLSETIVRSVMNKVGNENLEIVNQIEIYENDAAGSSFVTDRKTRQLYDRYKNEATLVITSKLHCASPCIAMGIPVIVIREKKSCRFEWINKLIPVYTLENLDKINWNPNSIEIEQLKRKMRNNISKRIQESYSMYSDRMNISDFFESCEHEEACSVSDQIVNAIKDSGKREYIIWGVGGYLGNAIYHIISREFPEAVMVAAVDEYKDCEFHGIRTIRSDKLQNFRDVFIIVTTATGESSAVQYLKEIGLKPREDYFTFSMIN